MKPALLLAFCGTLCFALPSHSDNLQFRTEKNPPLLDLFVHTDHFLDRLLEASYDAHPDWSGVATGDDLRDDSLVNSTLAHTDWKGSEELSEEEFLQKIANVGAMELTRYEDIFLLQRQKIATRLQKSRGTSRGVRGQVWSMEQYTGHLVKLPDISHTWSFDQPPYRRSPAPLVR